MHVPSMVLEVDLGSSVDTDAVMSCSSGGLKNVAQDTDGCSMNSYSIFLKPRPIPCNRSEVQEALVTPPVARPLAAPLISPLLCTTVLAS
jgi:hypothetical protein